MSKQQTSPQVHQQLNMEVNDQIDQILTATQSEQIIQTVQQDQQVLSKKKIDHKPQDQLVLNHDDFKAEFVLENKKLKKIIIWMMVIFPIIILLSLSMDRYFIIKNKNLFDKQLHLSEVCALSFENLFSPEPKKSLIGTEIIKQLKEHSLEFDLNKILKVSDIGDKKCQIIASLSNGHGSFELIMDESSNYPFGYILKELIEVELADKSIQEINSETMEKEE